MILCRYGSWWLYFFQDDFPLKETSPTSEVDTMRNKGTITKWNRDYAFWGLYFWIYIVSVCRVIYLGHKFVNYLPQRWQIVDGWSALALPPSLWILGHQSSANTVQFLKSVLILHIVICIAWWFMNYSSENVTQKHSSFQCLSSYL